MTNQTQERQSWSSRLTYILTVAGATIGFGATWRFPYLVGENGGGAYVFVFILAMFIIGIPMILVENVIGRRIQVNSIDAFSGTANGKPIHPAWKILGYMGLLGSFGIMAYYMVIGGWVFNYIGSVLVGALDLSSPVTKEVTGAFLDESFHRSTGTILAYTALFAAINWVILSKGIVDGIERAVKFLMPILFVFLTIMVIRNVTLPGAMVGIKFYLYPDFSKITGDLFLMVLGQVFFALSIGFGVLITLSSYLDKKENLVQTATITAFVNTLIAVFAGFMIFPSLFSYGVDPAAGPTLVFESLPIVFSRMWGGPVFAITFFGLLIIAALTTSLTIYEVIITAIEEKTNLGRQAAIAITIGGIFVLGNIPSVLGDTVWQGLTIVGERSIFDSFDYISGNILFVLTALGSALFVGFVLKDDAKKELNTSPLLTTLWFNYVKFVIPVIILVIFYNSL